jgi:hypothetical protein
MTELDKIEATLKTGQERIVFNERELDFSLLDFWRWSVSDILSNATRGRFAEFVVATATQIEITNVRDEWNSFDLETPEKIKLEIKSSAYIQSWHQNKPSTISFKTKPAFFFDSLTGVQSLTKRRTADVYVFCLLHGTEPLNMNNWEFFVMATKELNEYHRSHHSIGLKSLQNLTHSVTYDKLYEKIKEKNSLNFKE